MWRLYAGASGRRSIRTAAACLMVVAMFAVSCTPATTPMGEQVPTDLEQPDQRRPVIFVPGWGLTCGTSPAFEWLTWTKALERRGFTPAEYKVFPLERCLPVEESALKLGKLIEEVLTETGAQQVDIIAHSMGSIVARWCVVFGSCGEVTANYISLAGANQGTELAHLCPLQFWSDSCSAMTPGSEQLNELNGVDQTPGAIRWQAWVSWCETVILPNVNALLNGAENHVVPYCVMHDDWKRDFQTIPHILDSLGLARPA